MTRRSFLFSIAAALFAAGLLLIQMDRAPAQSTCSNIAPNAVLTAAQWNFCFSSKQDYVPPVIQVTTVTNAIGADVLLSNTGVYFDGPIVTQSNAGTWFVSGTVTLTDTSGAASFSAKLWDGTTIIASAQEGSIGAANGVVLISLSGIIVSPVGNLRISVKDATSTSGKILFNSSGNSKDSTVSAIRTS
jgi:hypothetical protein